MARERKEERSAAIEAQQNNEVAIAEQNAQIDEQLEHRHSAQEPADQSLCYAGARVGASRANIKRKDDGKGKSMKSPRRATSHEHQVIL